MFGSRALLTLVDTLAARVKKLRETLGWTQQQLADAANVSQSMIGNIESGARAQPRKLPQLAKALGVTAEYLSSGEGPERPYNLSDPAMARVLKVMSGATQSTREKIAKLVEAIADQ